MGILDEVTGWVLVVLAVMTASGRLRELVRTRRSGARFSEVPDSVWSGLSFSLIWVGLGVNALLGPDPQWLGWLFFLVAVAAVTSVAAVGIVSRQSAGVARWRFWAQVAPPPAKAERPDADLADTPEPRSAIVLDATTVDLIERIKNATFGTTRFSTGYDEEEVDNFLDQIVAVLGEAGLPGPAELGNAQFTTVRLRPGYVRRDVDSLLHEISQATLA
jgi:DivIVA domain-containing protein